jgi:hypothetical protein
MIFSLKPIRMNLIFKLLVITFSLLPVEKVFPVPDLPEDINKQVVAAILSGNAGELEKYFNSMIDLTVGKNEDTYSRNQAGRIIKDFFDHNPVKSFKVNKQGTSNDGSQYSVGELHSGDKVFRVFYLIKKTGNVYLIQQLQIQEQ